MCLCLGPRMIQKALRKEWLCHILCWGSTEINSEPDKYTGRMGTWMGWDCDLGSPIVLWWMGVKADKWPFLCSKHTNKYWISLASWIRFKHYAKNLGNYPYETSLPFSVLWDREDTLGQRINPFIILQGPSQGRHLPGSSCYCLSPVDPSKVITWWYELSLSAWPVSEKSHWQPRVSLFSKALSQINRF